MFIIHPELLNEKFFLEIIKNILIDRYIIWKFYAIALFSKYVFVYAKIELIEFVEEWELLFFEDYEKTSLFIFIETFAEIGKYICLEMTWKK